MDTPFLPTDLRMAATPLGKPTAGDVVELTVTPPADSSDAAPEMADALKQGPVKWGEGGEKAGRILSWEVNGGKILVRLTTYAPGKFTIPPIPFQKNGKTVFRTEPKEVEFASVGAQQGEVGIYEPQAVALPRWVLFGGAFLVLAAAVAALALIARAARRRRERMQALAAAPKALNPLEDFLEKIRATETKGYLGRDLQKPHYFALSDAAKRFLGKALGFDAEERTTRELARELEKALFDRDLVRSWVEIFEEMDVVKFTDQKAPDAQAKAIADRLGKMASATYRANHGISR